MAAAPKSEITPASTTKELEERLRIPIASVTERTTRLIGGDRDQVN